MTIQTVDASHALSAGCRLLFDRNPLPMWVYDLRNLRMLAVNDAALARYRYSRQSFIALSLPDLYHPDHATHLHAELQRAHACGAGARWRLRCSDGEPVEVEIVSEDVEFAGNPARMALVSDLGEKHRAEQELLEEREALRTVVDTTTDAILNVDQDGKICAFNTGAENVFHRTRQSMLGQGIEMLLPERFRSEHPLQMHAFAQSGVRSRKMGVSLVKGLRADGQELDLEGNISQLVVGPRRVTVVCLRDVTRRVRSDAEFARSRSQLADLTHKLMQQEKILVHRLAQSLHDQLGQTIAAIRMAHDTVVALQEGEPAGAVKRVQDQMGTLIGQAVHQVRQVLMDLRPPLLEEQGLAAALDNELRSRSLAFPQMDILIDLAPQVAPMRWPHEVEYAAFMVAREAVDNALRHAGATTIHACLQGSSSLLQLEVTDDGVGMTEGAAPQTGHLGILGMRERAQAVGADFCMRSSENPGTRVSFCWQETV